MRTEATHLGVHAARGVAGLRQFASVAWRRLGPARRLALLATWSCAPAGGPTESGSTAADQIPATVNVEATWRVEIDGVTACDVAITWAGLGSVGDCPTCDFSFEIDQVTVSEEGNFACYEGGSVTLALGLFDDDAGTREYYSYWMEYSQSETRDNRYGWYATFYGLFATGFWGYPRYSGYALVDWDRCDRCSGPPPGQFTRSANDLSWDITRSDTYTNESVEHERVSTFVANGAIEPDL